LNLIVINADEDSAVFTKELAEQGQAGVHHAQPAVVSVQGFPLAANDLA